MDIRGEIQHLCTRIYCFTGTGNSLMIARAIAVELGETEIVGIPHAIRDVVHERYDCVGLVFPVYYGGLPAIVQRFLPALRPLRESYFFSVVTYAGGFGRVFSQLRAELQQIGLDLASGFRLRMPQNFIMSYDVPTGDEVEETLDYALSKISMIIENIRGKRVFRPPNDFPTYSGQTKRYLDFIAGVLRTDTQFWCDDGCTQCEVCVRVCPVSNIEMDNGQPRWLHHCEQCLACINWCPMNAIQYDQRTSDKGRYTNPNVTIEDLVSIIDIK